MYCQYSECECIACLQIENACEDCELKFQKEYGITATFTDEEFTVILHALSDRYENTEKLKEQSVNEEDVRYWSNESKLAINTYQKILAGNKVIPK